MYKPTQTRYKTRLGIDTVFVLTVFALFICALLAAVLTFAKIYKLNGDRINTRFTAGTSSALIMQKLRAYDYEGGIKADNIDGISVLCLNEEFEGEEYTTYIYCYDGELRELLIGKNEEFIADYGNILMPVYGFEVTATEDTVTFTLEFSEDSSETCMFAINSGKEVA